MRAVRCSPLKALNKASLVGRGVARLAITRWPDRDEAFEHVVTEISRTIEDLLKTKEDWLKEGATLYDLQRYEEALAAFEQAIGLDPNLVKAYTNKGNALYDLQRYEEALAAYEQVTGLDPNSSYAYNCQGKALDNLNRYEEALAAYEQAAILLLEKSGSK